MILLLYRRNWTNVSQAFGPHGQFAKRGHLSWWVWSATCKMVETIKVTGLARDRRNNRSLTFYGSYGNRKNEWGINRNVCSPLCFYTKKIFKFMMKRLILFSVFSLLIADVFLARLIGTCITNLNYTTKKDKYLFVTVLKTTVFICFLLQEWLKNRVMIITANILV